MGLSFKLPLPTLSGLGLPQERGRWCVSITGPVWGERDGAGGLAGLEPHGSVQDSLHYRIKSAAVAVASEEHILLARAQVLPAPTSSLPGLPALGCHLAWLWPWIHNSVLCGEWWIVGSRAECQKCFPGPRGLILWTPLGEMGRPRGESSWNGAPGGGDPAPFPCVTRNQSCPSLTYPTVVFFSKFCFQLCKKTPHKT